MGEMKERKKGRRKRKEKEVKTEKKMGEIAAMCVCVTGKLICVGMLLNLCLRTPTTLWELHAASRYRTTILYFPSDVRLSERQLLSACPFILVSFAYHCLYIYLTYLFIHLFIFYIH